MSDHFSRQSDVYAKYRPTYPQDLINFVVSHCKHRKAAWDCATGNGQTAKELSRFFETVYATDISQQQLDYAFYEKNIIYSREVAEQTSLPNGSIDLITVSQALHWFKFDEFYAEVKRVAASSGWIAVWVYPLLKITPEIDAIINRYHFETLRDYWDPARKYVDDNYATLPFPFEEIKTPEFAIEYEWTLGELEGYFNTWSALQQFIKKNGFNPVPSLMHDISFYWQEETMRIIFPLHLRMAPVH